MTPVKVFGYVRVSSVEQESGFGKEAQAAAILAWVSTNKLPEPDIRYETATGTDKDRLVINQVYTEAEELIKSGTEVHLVFKCLDRLSRLMLHMEEFISSAWDKGILLHSTDGAENAYVDKKTSQDPKIVFIRRVLSASVELEKAILRGRLDGGKKEKGKKGGFTGGSPPFGYSIKDRELVIDSMKAVVVRRIFDLVSQGKSDKQVAGIMFQEFPKTPIWSKDKNNPRYMAWSDTAIFRIRGRHRLYAEGYLSDVAGDSHLRPDLVILK